MRCVLAVLALAAVALAADIETEEGVIVGTADNFDSVIADNEFVLAEFYAPWCGHCKQLAPEYAKAAQQLESEGSDIKLVKVDATVHDELAEKFEVQGYPTIKFFKGGKATEYGGGRTASDIVAWLKKKSGPPAPVVADVAAVDAAFENVDVLVVGIFDSADSDEAKAFVEVADAIEASFVLAHDAAIASEYEVASPSIVLLKKFDEGKVVFDGEFSVDEITKFVAGNQLPLVIEFTDEAAPKIFGGDVKTHVLLFADTSADDFAGHKAALTAVAAENKGELLFIYIDSVAEDNARILEFFGLTGEDCPALRLINLSDQMAKYTPETSEINEDNLRAFVESFKAGTLKQHLNSEDIPADWDSAPVKVLVGKNFEDVALDTGKNVLVEFYAPWCGHCKQLAPIWDQLGAAVEGEDNIVIAKMDSTKNEVEQVSIESFPTIKFFPAGENAEMVDYDGARTLEGFAAFLKEHTGVEISTESADGDDAAAAGDEGHDEL